MDLPASWIYDPENFDPYPPQEVICSICHSVLQNPVQSPCQHVFCRNCIYQWLVNNSTCPFCRKRLTPQAVGDVMPLFKSLILGLKLRCPNVERGCATKFTLQNSQYHMLKCLYEPLTEEEQRQIQPADNLVTQLLKASSDRSLHHLIPRILRTENESINVRATGFYKATPIFVALFKGCSLETLDVLLDAGADVMEQDFFHYNALHCALRGKCSLPVIRKLLQCNIEMVHQRDYNDQTPLMCGLLCRCSLEVFRELVEAGADLSVLDDSLWTHLHCAVEGGSCKEILEEIIQRMPELIFRQNDQGRVPLHLATDEWVVRTLIDAGSDTGARDVDGNTPLQYALNWKELSDSTLMLFITNMSDEQLQQGNKYDETLLHTACKNRGAQLARRLMKCGLDPAKKNCKGETALHYLATFFLDQHKKCDLETVKELLRGNPHLVDIKNNEGKSPIAMSRDIELAREMVKWVSLQSEYFTQRMMDSIQDPYFKDNIVCFLKKCQTELELLQDRRIFWCFSMKDLLLKGYLTECDSSSNEHGPTRNQVVGNHVPLDIDFRGLSVFLVEVVKTQNQIQYYVPQANDRTYYRH